MNLLDRHEDEEIYNFTGIREYHIKKESYSKQLYNNNSFAYDDYSIYLVDKLHFSYTTSYSNYHLKELRIELIDTSDTFYLSKFVSLQKSAVRYSGYKLSYNILVSGTTYGVLKTNKYDNNSQLGIEVSNQFLYNYSSYDLISNLFLVSKELNIYYKSICLYELARDFILPIYNDYLMILYQSDLCANQVHKANNSKPIFGRYGKSLYNPVVTDPKDKEYGTAYIGSDQSSTQLKIYNKNREIRQKGDAKGYINQIYQQHFGEKPIDRVEVSADSIFIKKNKLDLMDVLSPDNHPSIFKKLVGSKLTFKDLRTLYWVKGNDKYKLFDLLPEVEQHVNLKSIPIEIRPEHRHDKRIDKLKLMIHSYFDEEINYLAIHSFIKQNIWKEGFVEDRNFLFQVEKIFSLYRNAYTPDVMKKKIHVTNLIQSDGRLFKIMQTYFKLWI